jgi:hypothetical protein
MTCGEIRILKDGGAGAEAAEHPLVPGHQFDGNV